MYFFCECLGSNKCPGNINIQDLSEDVNRVVTSIAFSRDTCAYYKATEWVSELFADGVEDSSNTIGIDNVKLVIPGLRAVRGRDLFDRFC